MPKTPGMTNEAIDRGFYILAALSAVPVIAFVASLWFA